jgi:hypothetical protein
LNRPLDDGDAGPASAPGPAPDQPIHNQPQGATVTEPGAGTLGAARRLMWMLVVPVLALLLVLSTLQYQERIADAERELLRHADERAQELDALARPAIAHVHDLRRLLEERWDDPPTAARHCAWR